MHRREQLHRGVVPPDVRALVRQHGGDLTLASREGGGCAAALRLPKEAQA